jgi:hypothetical protein
LQRAKKSIIGDKGIMKSYDKQLYTELASAFGHSHYTVKELKEIRKRSKIIREQRPYFQEPGSLMDI